MVMLEIVVILWYGDVDGSIDLVKEVEVRGENVF